MKEDAWNNSSLLESIFSLFQKLNLNRIEIIMSVENIKSQKVAEKVNALKECVARNRIILNNKPIDAFVYSLIRDDLKYGDKN